MKKILSIVFFSVSAVLTAQAQVAEVTFETDDYASIGVYDSWENSPFRKGLLEGNVAVIDNPHTEVNEIMGVAPNPTAKVLAVQRSRYGSNQFGARIDLKKPFSLKPTTQYVHVLVHRPVMGRVMLMGLGKHREKEWAGQSQEVEQFWSISTTTVKPDMWTDAVFAIKGVSGVDIYSLVLVPECESTHDRAEDFIAYIDQIIVNTSSAPLIRYDDYPCNFDKATMTATRTDRGLLSVGLQDVKTLSITNSPSKSDPIYRNRMDEVFNVKAGQNVKPVVGYKGSSMCAYLYVDYGNDGKFSYAINDDYTIAAGSDLTTYSAYQKHNSEGTALPNNNTLNMPAFKIPTNTPKGFYRMRFKIDWNELDPGGNMASDNTIMQNGGGVVDVRLNVHEDNVSVMEDNRNGEILNADGTSLVTKTPFGQAFTIKLNPENGFTYNGVRIRHGYNLTGDSLVYGNVQYVDELISSENFDENDCYTIPAAWVDGDILLEGLFVEKVSHPDYPINYDKETAELTRTDRRLNGVTMNGVTYTLPAGKELYREDMSMTFFAKANENVSVEYSYTGGWMNGYVYIDKGQDGNFDVGNVTNGVIGSNSDVMTFSFWSGDNTNGQSGYNSKGVNLTGNARNVLNPPTFTMPQLADGFYRIRFKVDWNEIDPGGNTTDKNNIIHNGGGIVDARLCIYSNSTVNLILENSFYGTLTTPHGGVLPKTLPFNEPLTLHVTSPAGYRIDSLYVIHGNLSSEHILVHGVPQCLTTVYGADDFIFNELTLPPEIIDGDVRLVPVFVPDAPTKNFTRPVQMNDAKIVYDLQGRPVANLNDNPSLKLAKGIYIINGKKVVK